MEKTCAILSKYYPTMVALNNIGVFNEGDS